MNISFSCLLLTMDLLGNGQAAMEIWIEELTKARAAYRKKYKKYGEKMRGEKGFDKSLNYECIFEVVSFSIS